MEPSSAQPQDVPPPPPPPPAGDEANAAPAPQPPPAPAASADGQWVYARQYGWLWMRYADAFTYVPPDGVGEPMEYVFHPSVGWTWVVAPWVWGVGPWPWFGAVGPAHFVWYRHGWWRTPGRWRFRPAPARGALAARGIRPAPFRGARRSAHEGGHHR